MYRTQDDDRQAAATAAAAIAAGGSGSRVATKEYPKGDVHEKIMSQAVAKLRSNWKVHGKNTRLHGKSAVVAEFQALHPEWTPCHPSTLGLRAGRPYDGKQTNIDKRALSDEQEKDIAVFVAEADARQVNLTTPQIVKLVEVFVAKNPELQAKFKNNLPSGAWVRDRYGTTNIWGHLCTLHI